MGTSNWQNIPFCVEALMKIAPDRVLDVGVGYGRWGMIVREFCDLWYGRVQRKDWRVCIEGVEAFPPNIDQYHAFFYNDIKIGDFRKIAPQLTNRYNIIIFGDVLEHFAKQEAKDLLHWATGLSDYVLVNIPLGADWPQDEMYENSYERHLSAWELEEFQAYSLRRYSLFRDYIDRPFGSFVLSQQDPKGLSEQLFSKGTAVNSRTNKATDEHRQAEQNRLLNRVEELVGELERIKRARSYRIATRLNTHPLTRGILHTLLRRPRPTNGATQAPSQPAAVQAGPVVQLRATNASHADSKGKEVWLTAVNTPKGDSLDLKSFKASPHWECRGNQVTPTGNMLISMGQGTVEIPANGPMTLVFASHPWCGIAKITGLGCDVDVDLFSSVGRTVHVDLPGGQVRYISPPAQDQANTASRTEPLERPAGDAEFREADRTWIAAASQKAQPVAVMHPAWRGIRSSSLELFDTYYLIDDSLDESCAMYYARLFAEAQVPAVVLQGFPATYAHLARAMRKVASHIPVYVMWHGTFLKAREDYVWDRMRVIESLCRDGLIAKWGFTKKGMAEIMAARGIRSGFVMNRVRAIPREASRPNEGGPHLGIWTLHEMWHKPPYEVLAAASTVPGAIVHMSGASQRAREFAAAMGLGIQHMEPDAVDHEDMSHALSQMHLNLYVTFNECAPMLPLESLAAGAPCLIGPTTHYFEEHEYLQERLIVPQPDNASVIASYARRALEERERIIEAYRQYAPGYNARAEQSLRDFLELPQHAAIR